MSTQAPLDPAMDPRTDRTDPAPAAGINRRSVIQGACVVCVGVAGAGVLAACGGSSGGSAGDSGGSGSSGAGGAAKTYQASDIPVGGGKVFADDKIVVTQPTAGDFKAFSAVCTHQQFIVGNVQGGTINCFHHGSKYDQATGKNVAGPATSPLPEKTVTDSGGTLTVT